MKETGFRDPIPAKKDTKSVKNPWSFAAPPYDERSSCFVNAGTHHGMGHKSPVGHIGNPKSVVHALPQSHVGTMVVDEEG